MISSFETVAKHFAGKLKVKLQFKEKVSPQTDGEYKITLPKDMGDLTLPTLGALIHESYHIRHTGRLQSAYEKFWELDKKWFHGSSWNMKKQYAFLTNLLEDIRIDNMVLKKYENARYIYSTLIEFGCEIHNQKKEKKCDMLGIKFMELTQQIYIYALDFDKKYYFNKPLIDDFVLKYKKELDDILDNVKIRASVMDLYQDVNKLWIIVKEYLKIEEHKKYNKEIDGDGTKIISDSKIKKQIKKQYKESKEEKIEEANEKLDEIGEDIEDLENDLKEIEKEKKKEKKDREDEDVEDEDCLEKQDNEKEKKKINEKINKKEDQKKELKDQIKEDEKSIKNIEESDGDLDEVIDDILEEEFGDGEIQEKLLNGFKCVNKLTADLKTNIVDLIDFESSLKEIFKRTEKKKLYTTRVTPHINLKSLHKIYKHEGELTDLFSEMKKIETYNNKLIFLIDSSSSMGNCFMKYGGTGGKEDYKLSKKNSLVFDCLENIRKIIQENQDIYNIDYAVITFASAHQFGIVKNFDEIIENEKNFLKKYTSKYYNGSTAIIPALEKCYNLFDEHCQHRDKRFIICFTDGQFTSGDTEIILKEYNARTEKVVFIGINNKETLENRGETIRQFVEKILMGRVVNSVKEMEATLIESLDRIL
jgi:hypothetical protein